MDNNSTTAVPNPGTAYLTEESFETLKSMLQSKNEGDHKIAQLILNQLDIEANIMYIYDLAKNLYLSNNMVNLRTKASRQFRDASNLFYIANCSSYQFACWLLGKGWLTPERFQKLKPAIVKSLAFKDDNRFYRLHFEIRDDYRNLDSDNKLEPLKP